MVTGTRTYTGLPARTITFTYNPDGSRATMQLPVAPSGYTNSNCYSYAYDAGQRLTGITDNLGNTSTFRYGDNNWLLGHTSHTVRWRYNLVFSPNAEVRRELGRPGTQAAKGIPFTRVRTAASAIIGSSRTRE